MSKIDFDLDLSPAVLRGNAGAPLTVEVVREITPADLHLLATANRQTKVPELKRISDRHHMLARLLAAGVPDNEAALTCGYEAPRVWILKNSPAFQELLDLYREQVQEHYIGMLDHMAGLGRDALLELRDRLEDNPEDFSIDDLRKILNDMGDRTGAPRKSEQHREVTVNLGDRLEAARERARQARLRVIEDAEIVEDDPDAS